MTGICGRFPGFPLAHLCAQSAPTALGVSFEQRVRIEAVREKKRASKAANDKTDRISFTIKLMNNDTGQRSRTATGSFTFSRKAFSIERRSNFSAPEVRVFPPPERLSFVHVCGGCYALGQHRCAIWRQSDAWVLVVRDATGQSDLKKVIKPDLVAGRRSDEDAVGENSFYDRNLQPVKGQLQYAGRHGFPLSERARRIPPPEALHSARLVTAILSCIAVSSEGHLSL